MGFLAFLGCLGWRSRINRSILALESKAAELEKRVAEQEGLLALTDEEFNRRRQLQRAAIKKRERLWEAMDDFGRNFYALRELKSDVKRLSRYYLPSYVERAHEKLLDECRTSNQQFGEAVRRAMDAFKPALGELEQHLRIHSPGRSFSNELAGSAGTIGAAEMLLATSAAW